MIKEEVVDVRAVNNFVVLNDLKLLISENIFNHSTMVDKIVENLIRIVRV